MDLTEEEKARLRAHAQEVARQFQPGELEKRETWLQTWVRPTDEVVHQAFDTLEAGTEGIEREKALRVVYQVLLADRDPAGEFTYTMVEVSALLHSIANTPPERLADRNG